MNAAAQRAQERDRLVREQPADLGRAGGGRERRVDARRCRSDRNAGPSPIRVAHARAYSRGRPGPQLVAGHDLEAPRARLVEVRGGVERAAHPGQQRPRRVDQALLQRALERRAVEVALALVLLPGVGVGVEQHHRRPARGPRPARAARRARSSGRRRASSGIAPARSTGSSCAAICSRGAHARCPAWSSRSPRSASESEPKTSTSCAGFHGRSSSEASRIPAGPKRAPGRIEVAVSNGTPRTATSTSSAEAT